MTNSTRELINKGKVFRQPEGPIGSSWVELIVLLFDNYSESFDRRQSCYLIMCSRDSETGKAEQIIEAGRSSGPVHSESSGE